MSDPDDRADEQADATIDCIRDALADRGYPPSVKELAACLGVAIGTAHARLQDLETRGLIVKTPGIPRGIRIVED